LIGKIRIGKFPLGEHPGAALADARQTPKAGNHGTAATPHPLASRRD
jgi:hypothetical protein